MDRGGTFTDCLAISPSGGVHVTKVLSSDRAPLEAIESVLARADGGEASDVFLARADGGEASDVFLARADGGEASDKLLARAAAGEASGATPARVRLGTTVATNALLERRGAATALLTNAGLAGVFDVGTQERPALFELEIERPPRLQQWRLEAPGRRDALGAVVEPLDLGAAHRALARARREGAVSVAIVGLHAHVDPEDERALGRIAEALGFEHVALSHALAREVGFLARGETAIADAYLTPLLRGHVRRLEAALPRAELRFMQSSGGLTDAARFRGPNALLSGPAGGVVATRHVARRAGHARAIGFDMGGTSTDVSLVEGDRLDRAFESEVGGVRVKAPMLRIHTVAAGGGSLCRFDGIRLVVGPESAGSDPGPLCYGLRDGAGRPRAETLAVTDVNLALGRVAPDRFPFPLELAPVERALDELVERLSRAGFARTRDEVAAGFFEIANANMAQAIREVSVAGGVDPRDHVLVGFGGAGGQHVCAIARQLGLREILLHPFAGLLSAYGIGLAPLSWDGQRDGLGRLLPGSGALANELEVEWRALEDEARHALVAEGAALGSIELERSLDLGYVGTETALAIPWSPDASEQVAVGRARFAAAHRERYGYDRPGRAIAIKAVRLRAWSREVDRDLVDPPADVTQRTPARPRPLRTTRAWFPDAGRVDAPVYEREALEPGHRLAGPALVLEATGTVVLDPGFVLEVDADRVFRIRPADEARRAGPNARSRVDLAESDPVRLEVLGNRFMSIAEQMGAVLRNTSVSTNIKERLDYSCAVFDGEGGLVANAPHIPVHLGAMADTIAALRERFEPFAPGDVLVTNDPFAGGSHLPDVTVVTPVFRAGASRAAFFVASRGHHADLGGRTPGSMPADSERLDDEGVLIEPFHLVRAGRFDEAHIRAVLGAGPYPARRPDDNVADLEAMVAANRAGAALLDALCEEVGEAVVRVTMVQLQRAAATKVALELARLPAGRHRFADALDDGTPIAVELTIEHVAGTSGSDALPARTRIDFEGTGPASRGNLNAPPAVVRAAVLYVLRSLVAERIPLNGGCLAPVEIVVPPGSLLDPPRGSAVVGGNVETSQRIVDVLLGALGRAAASQGTMNNVTFGDEAFGYYETIGGGAGATPFAPGASGVHTHMTNTRITDPEILESRFPVRLLEFGLRPGSGGEGARRGGDGLVRRYRFLRPVRVSLLTERRTRSPFGLAGGGAGARGRNRILRQGRTAPEEVGSRATIELDAGDELWIETPGGGGHGRSEALEERDEREEARRT
ncbi:MAG: hydantoinase B/oxoprolinase family protein [Spirochaetaceae bacterium]|nr:hydantoinase B/oxoprolinase family protein [Spirochaetaceae bacterium]